MVAPSKWYYFDWTFGEFYCYGIAFDYHSFTVATPLFAFSIANNKPPYVGYPRFAWGIWRLRNLREGDFLYKYHN